MEYSAGVFAVPDRLIIFSSPMAGNEVRTVGGVVTVPRNADRQSIGTLVQQALLASDEVVGEPTQADWERRYGALFAGTEFPTLKAFFSAAVLVSIDVDNEGSTKVSRGRKPTGRGVVDLVVDGGPFGSEGGLAIADAVLQLLAGEET